MEGLDCLQLHYENIPIQVYWKFYHQNKKKKKKNESFQVKNSGSFHVFAQSIDYWYSLEPPRRGGSNEYPRAMFSSKNKKK